MAYSVAIDHRLFDLDSIDLSPFGDFIFSNDAALQRFDSNYINWTPTVLSASLIQFGGAGVYFPASYDILLVGSGIGPISSLADLATAISNGIASGSVSSMTLMEGPLALASITFASGGYTVTSGNFSVAFTGAAPTGLQEMSDVAGLLGSLANIDMMSQAEISQLITDLTPYALTGMAITTNGNPVLSITQTSTAITVNILGVELTINGTFPTNFGAEVAVALDFATNMQSGQPFDLSDIAGFAFDSLTITDPDSNILLTATGPFLGYGNDVLSSATIDGVTVSNNMSNLVAGDSEDNSLFGTAGTDHLIGFGGHDYLRSGDGNDYLFGGSGHDNLDGEEGSDYVNPGTNSWFDLIWGSRGNDTIDYSDNGTTGFQEIRYFNLNAGITATINGIANTGTIDKGANGTDTIINVQVPFLAGALSVTGGFGIFGTNYDDVFTINPVANSWSMIGGGDGADTYNVTLAGNVVLDFRGTGAGTAPPTQGVDIKAKTGTITDDGYGNAETLNVTRGPGELQIRGTGYQDLIIGHNGKDGLRGYGENDILRGLKGADTLSGGDDNDNLFGGSGRDILNGDDGRDRLRGGAGNDELNGGAGRDFLIGEGGRDSFIFSAGMGRDIIRDMTDNIDTVMLDEALWGGGLKRAQVLNTYATDVAGDVFFDFGGGNTLLIEDFTKADLVNDLTII